MSHHCDKFRDGSVCMKRADHYGDCQSFREYLDELHDFINLRFLDPVPDD